MRLKPLFGALLASSLCALPASDAAARRPAGRNVEASLTAASSFCEAAAAQRPGQGLPVPVAEGIVVHDGSPPALGVPDIVKRFAATQPSGAIAAGPPFYLQFSATDGQVWAVAYDSPVGCDVMVTGSDGNMPALALRLVKALSAKGWHEVRAVPATADSPLAQHVLTREGPDGRGSRLAIRALAPAAAGRDGVQMSLGFLAGAIEPASPALR